MDDSLEDGVDFLGGYGVLIVPPEVRDGAWFVGVASWDQEAEVYVATTDGPMSGTRGEAEQQAQHVLDWLLRQQGRGDLARLWERMQTEILGVTLPPLDEME